MRKPGETSIPESSIQLDPVDGGLLPHSASFSYHWRTALYVGQHPFQSSSVTTGQFRQGCNFGLKSRGTEPEAPKAPAPRIDRDSEGVERVENGEGTPLPADYGVWGSGQIIS